MSNTYFRVKAQLASGNRVYDSLGASILCYPELNRASVEATKHALYERQDYAYSHDLHEFRPAWCFPRHCSVDRVTGYVYETMDEPLDEKALLITGEKVDQEVPQKLVGHAG